MVDHTQILLDKYGISPPPCGAQVGPGWVPLLERLIMDLIALGWDRDCHQVKEKFGGLRFYTGPVSEACFQRIREAESESMRTCTVCGGPADPEKMGWGRKCSTHGG